MIILGIETSCDETSAAIIEANNDQITLRSNIVASSLSLHAKTGGVIPEIAAREQLKFMLPVLEESLQKAFAISGTFDILNTLQKVDAIAVTYGPGLIGSLLVGVETARTLAYVLNKPIIPVNHMMGHIYANWLKKTAPIQFPAIALVVSGCHTDLLLLKNHGEYVLLGGTRDDAAGEAFDKIGRLLGFPYPAGPAIEALAKEGDPKRFRFPRPLVGSGHFEFSFSGLKTAVLREVQHLRSKNQELDTQTIKDLARGTQDAIIDVITKKTMKAVENYNAQSLLLSGGVAANQTLNDVLSDRCVELAVTFFAPPKNLCTDNAAMIASAAYFNQQTIAWQDLTADPELYFDEVVF